MILPNTAMLEIQISWTPEFIFFAFLKHNVEKPLLPNLDYYLFFFFLATPCSLRNLSSPTRDWIPGPWQWKHQILISEPPGYTWGYYYSNSDDHIPGVSRLQKQILYNKKLLNLLDLTMHFIKLVYYF